MSLAWPSWRENVPIIETFDLRCSWKHLKHLLPFEHGPYADGFTEIVDEVSILTQRISAKSHEFCFDKKA